MSFWIRKYNIELEHLPLPLLTKSVIVIFVCLAILASILLLLPIQDKIKGDVFIYAKGQALAVNAPSDGFVHLRVKNDQLIEKGDLLATIDVDVSSEDLKQLNELIEQQLHFTDLNKAESLIASITPIINMDLRDIRIELQLLLDILQQLTFYAQVSNPSEYLRSLEKSITDKRERIHLIEELGASNDTLLLSLKDQLATDRNLLDSGLMAQVRYNDRYRSYIERESSKIENELRRRDLNSEILKDEQVQILSNRTYRARLQEFRSSLYNQLGRIRKAYLDFQKTHLLIAPMKGVISLRNDLVNQEMTTAGEPLMFLTPAGKEHRTHAEMFVGAENAGAIKPNMKVRIGLSEFDQKEFGIYYTTVLKVSEVPQDNKYKITLDCELPLVTSYKISLPERDNYKGEGEVLLGQINLLTKISREIQFNKTKYASL